MGMGEVSGNMDGGGRWRRDWRAVVRDWHIGMLCWKAAKLTCRNYLLCAELDADGSATQIRKAQNRIAQREFRLRKQQYVSACQ